MTGVLNPGMSTLGGNSQESRQPWGPNLPLSTHTATDAANPRRGA